MRLNASASNIANALTTGSLNDPENVPYTPLDTTSQAQGAETGGVQTNYTARDPAFIPAYDPDSPFADENGIIGAPNVSFAEEIVNMKLAEFAYKANINTIKTAGELFDEVLDIFDKR